MNRDRFVECVSRRINNGKCDLFIGSGISCESGVPSWRELLKPMAEDLGICLSDQDNLPMIAQYIVNENSGNRNVIRTRVMEMFYNESYEINRYHKAIRNMNVCSIWTTNCDHLIENSMSEKKYHVISSDADLGKPRNDKEETEIIKMHGSIDGDLNEIVLTQQDYDEFIFKKPAIAQRLRDTLIKKSVLFIGYGYNDPDIRTIMIEAMKLIKDNSQEHYIILLDEKKNAELEKGNNAEYQNKLRFELWKKELNRIGIRELVVESKNELNEVLNEISWQSRGRNVFVTGSHMMTTADIGQELGRLLAQEEICLINGQSDGIGMQILQGFMEECIRQKKDLSERLRLYPNPYATNSDYANNIELIPILKKERRVLMTDVKVFAFFKGGIGTKAEYEVAIDCECLILPLITDEKDYSDELINKFCSDTKHMEKLQKKSSDYYKILVEKKLPMVKQIVEAIRSMVF